MTETQQYSATTRPGPPPLRIHHLMACAVVAAVQFSLWRLVYEYPIQQSSVVYAAMMVVIGGLTSIGITLAIFSVYWQAKGLAGVMQPGQWLLVGFIVWTIGGLVTTVLVMKLGPGAFPGSSGSSYVWFTLFILASVIIPLLFYCWGAWRTADTVAWRLVFGVLALSPILTSGVLYPVLALLFGPRYLAWIPYSDVGRRCLVLLLEVYAVLGDFAARRPRFWTHWAGIGLSVAVQLVAIIGGAILLLYVVR